MALVRDGFAWRYTAYEKQGEYAVAEAAARKARRALWADKDPTPAWEFQRKK